MDGTGGAHAVGKEDEAVVAEREDEVRLAEQVNIEMAPPPPSPKKPASDGNAKFVEAVYPLNAEAAEVFRKKLIGFGASKALANLLAEAQACAWAVAAAGLPEPARASIPGLDEIRRLAQSAWPGQGDWRLKALELTKVPRSSGQAKARCG